MTFLFFKRFTDIFFSSIALVILCPVFLLISIAIKLTSSGPVLYRGKRTGLNDSSFRILKFRTMVENAELIGGFSTAIDDPRLTSIGGFLRSKKLDELPQFINVLLGDMSLVGPRPQVSFYTDKYTSEEKKILSMKPGITDLASLYFSNMDESLGSGKVDTFYFHQVEPIKNKLRLRYINECSYLLDIRILFETAFKLIGINNITGLKLESKN